MRRVLFVVLFVVAALVFVSGQSYAVTGHCGNCHTMHNSQNNASMNYDSSTTPNPVLLRGTCTGCHAQGTADNGPSGGNSIPPQVLHTNATALAGGNFGYITGVAGSGASASKGHNAVGVTSVEAMTAPGGTQSQRVTCAGGTGPGATSAGCHGDRANQGTDMAAIAGSHHGNVGGQLSTASTVGNSYRFLLGIYGTEDTDWQHTNSSTDHNEYYSGNTGNVSTNGIAKLCASCHSNFHSLANTQSGAEWIRHPVEYPIGGTFATNYTNTYSVTVPVGRTSVAAATSSVASSDTVMCLTCHVAHASNYADALRWDYSANVTGDSVGCNKCHAK